jgi:predicted nucleic acid-binding Zn ribbon protein
MPTRYDDPPDDDDDDGRDDWSDDDSDDGEPWSEDSDSNGVTDLCPYCHTEIYDDAVRCPNCTRYLSAEDAPPRNLPLWLLIGTILALISVWLTLGL